MAQAARHRRCTVQDFCGRLGCQGIGQFTLAFWLGQALTQSLVPVAKPRVVTSDQIHQHARRQLAGCAMLLLHQPFSPQGASGRVAFVAAGHLAFDVCVLAIGQAHVFLKTRAVLAQVVPQAGGACPVAGRAGIPTTPANSPATTATDCR